MDIELLQLKTIHEIRALATQKGLRWLPTEKKLELIARIAEIPDTPKPEKKPIEEKKEVVVHTATQQEILAAIDDNLKRGLKIKFNEDHWHMRNARGREDTGCYTTPLSVVKRIADGLVCTTS